MSAWFLTPMRDHQRNADIMEREAACCVPGLAKFGENWIIRGMEMIRYPCRRGKLLSKLNMPLALLIRS